MGWIALATALITGLVTFFVWLISDKRKVVNLKARQYELEEKLRRALAVNDTIAISTISIELNRVRLELKGYSNAK